MNKRSSMVWCMAAMSFAAGVAAQTYPSRPVRIVIPFAAGGGNDIVARVMATKLGEAFGQPAIVDNRPGGQGIIAAENVMKAPADGHTILMGPSGVMSVNPAVLSKLPYNTLRDFIPVSMVGSFPLVLVVNSNLPVKNVKELVEYARARPDQANYGSTSSLFQLATELFNQKTGSKFQHIPYKSSGDFVNAILAGEITIAFADPPPSAAHLKSGRLRGLGVTSPARHPSWPDVPTMAEAGVPDMAFLIWMGLFAPAGTPPAVVARLRDEVVRVLGQADVRERFAALGIEPSPVAGDEFAKIVAADIARWTAVAKAANIRSD